MQLFYSTIELHLFATAIRLRPPGAGVFRCRCRRRAPLVDRPSHRHHLTEELQLSDDNTKNSQLYAQGAAPTLTCGQRAREKPPAVVAACSTSTLCAERCGAVASTSDLNQAHIYDRKALAGRRHCAEASPAQAAVSVPHHARAAWTAQLPSCPASGPPAMRHRASLLWSRIFSLVKLTLAPPITSDCTLVFAGVCCASVDQRMSAGQGAGRAS